MNSKPGQADLRSALDEAVIRTFEELFFLETIRLPDEESLGDCDHSLHLDVCQQTPWRLILRLHQDLMMRLVSDIFSGSNIPPETNREDEDCLCELLNIIAGRFLKAVHLSDWSYHLSLPQMDTGPISAIEGTVVSGVYSAEGMSFMLAVTGNR